ncbi:Hypothetical predicted protein, partial [Paramuricea clavata]
WCASFQTKNVLQNVFFEACVPYFMKATVENLGESGLSLTAVLYNTSSQQTNFEESLFWILPGELQVDLTFENQGVLQTTKSRYYEVKMSYLRVNPVVVVRKWNTAWVHLSIDEMFKVFVFEVIHELQSRNASSLRHVYRDSASEISENLLSNYKLKGAEELSLSESIKIINDDRYSSINFHEEIKLHITFFVRLFSILFVGFSENTSPRIITNSLELQGNIAFTYISSPVLHEVQFFYHMSGKDIALVTVHDENEFMIILEAGVGLIVSPHHFLKVCYYTRCIKDVKTSQEYALSFKAIVNEGSASCVVAIDELNLTPKPCTSIKEGRWLVNLSFKSKIKLTQSRPIWRNPVKDCEGGTTFNNSCYKIVKKRSNWFDAIDQCKSLGGSLVTINSLQEAKFITANFTNMSLIWLGDIGQFSYGSMAWTNESHGNVSRNETFEKNGYMYANLSLNATYGNTTLKGTLKHETSQLMTRQEESFLCPVFSKEYILGVNCSYLLFTICEIPGEILDGEGGGKGGKERKGGWKGWKGRGRRIKWKERSR